MVSKFKVVILILLVIFSLYFLIERFLLPKEEIKEVGIAEIKRGKIESTIEAQGRIGFSLIRTIYAKEEGIIKLLKVKEGDKVEVGNSLCIILNPSLFESKPEIEKAIFKSNFSFLIEYLRKKHHRILESLEEAYLTYLAAYEKYHQYELLYSKKAISHQQLKEQKTFFKQAELKYYSAKSEFEEKIRQARINTPISGTIIKVFCTEGQEVKIGQELFVIADLRTTQAELEVDEFQVDRIKEGLSVEINAETLPTLLKGKVKTIGIYAESQDPRFVAKIPVICSIEIPYGVTPILGSSVNAKIILESKDNVLLCPRVALLASSERNAVWTINEGKASLRPIMVGIKSDEMVEIVDGLKEKEKVIIEGSLSIKEGDKLKIK